MPITSVTLSCSRQLQLIADLIARSKKALVVTGAGISTNCGIPDFRSVDGLYSLVKAQYPNAVVKGRDLFDSVLWSDPISTSLFYTFLASLRNEVLNVKEPSAVHKFIRTLAETGRLLRCYTQNIDGLEEREGLVVNLSHGKGKRKRPSPIAADDNRTEKEKGCQVVQLHGNLKTLRCTNCQLLTDYTPAAVSTLLSGSAPVCMACETASESRQAAGKRATKVGLLRPNVVLYGEEHPDADMVGKLAEADINASPDLLVILGTSLKVHGLKILVKEFAKAVHARGGSVVFVNNTPPPESVWNEIIDFHVEMDCDAWVADVKARRVGIWERQTKLPVHKMTKATATAADKENLGKQQQQQRQVLEPKTPSRNRAKKALKAAPYMSPPCSRKRISKKTEFLADFETKIMCTPSKHPKTTTLLPSSPPSPPDTPTITSGRLVAIEISYASSPEKQLRKELQIFEDCTSGKGRKKIEKAPAAPKNKKPASGSSGKSAVAPKKAGEGEEEAPKPTFKKAAPTQPPKQTTAPKRAVRVAPTQPSKQAATPKRAVPAAPTQPRKQAATPKRAVPAASKPTPKKTATPKRVAPAPAPPKKTVASKKPAVIYDTIRVQRQQEPLTRRRSFRNITVAV